MENKNEMTQREVFINMLLRDGFQVITYQDSQIVMRNKDNDEFVIVYANGGLHFLKDKQKDTFCPADLQAWDPLSKVIYHRGARSLKGWKIGHGLYTWGDSYTKA